MISVSHWRLDSRNLASYLLVARRLFLQSFGTRPVKPPPPLTPLLKKKKRKKGRKREKKRKTRKKERKENEKVDWGWGVLGFGMEVEVLVLFSDSQ